MMTKPYVAGSAYINRMSDHCKSCQFHHKKTCPMTRLYWAYLNRHGPSFTGNHRMAIAMKNVARRADEEKALDAATFEHVRSTPCSTVKRFVPPLRAIFARGHEPRREGWQVGQ